MEITFYYGLISGCVITYIIIRLGWVKVKTKTPDPIEHKAEGQCMVPECDKPIYNVGMCFHHYCITDEYP